MFSPNPVEIAVALGLCALLCAAVLWLRKRSRSRPGWSPHISRIERGCQGDWEPRDCLGSGFISSRSEQTAFVSISLQWDLWNSGFPGGTRPARLLVRRSRRLFRAGTIPDAQAHSHCRKDSVTCFRYAGNRNRADEAGQF